MSKTKIIDIYFLHMNPNKIIEEFPKLIKTCKKARLIMMIDATGSMSSLFGQLKISLPQIFDDTYQILREEKFNGCLEMQMVLYRNYESNFNSILEVSTFDSQGYILKSFLNRSQASGGYGRHEAVQVALQYVNKLENINEIILMGDAAGNTPFEVQQKRNAYPHLQSQRIKNGMHATTTEKEINQLIQKSVKISGFYLQTYPDLREYFERVSRLTNGEARYINVYDANASHIMTQFIVERALRIIGNQDGKGEQLIAAYAEILKKRMGR